MSFFNKKEEVLEFKLTEYGKRKLQLGRLNPTFYAFFDDDILYDGARCGYTEDNNDIEPRIQENTPSQRVQTSFSDLEKKVKKQTQVNRIRKSKYKSAVKQMEQLLKNKDKEKAKKYFSKFQSILMQVAKSGIISKNTAARKTSRISKKISSN